MYVNSTDNSIYIGNAINAPVKLITELNIGDYETGGSAHDWPSKADLTLGNTVVWAGENWLVCHTTETEAYLILTYAYSQCTFSSLQSQCNSFRDSKFTQDQLAVLKPITPPNLGPGDDSRGEGQDMYSTTTGKVFVPCRSQFNGSFTWFNSNSRRAFSCNYWTCSYDPSTQWGDFDQRDSYQIYVNLNGYFGENGNSTSYLEYGFRPAICIDLSLY